MDNILEQIKLEIKLDDANAKNGLKTLDKDLRVTLELMQKAAKETQKKHFIDPKEIETTKKSLEGLMKKIEAINKGGGGKKKNPFKNLRKDADDLLKSVKSVSAEMKKVAEDERNASKNTRIGSIAKSWAAMSALIPSFKQLLNVANLLADKISEVYTSYVDFAKSLSTLRTLTGSTFDETMKMAEGAKNISREFSMATSEVVEFMTVISRLGVAKEGLEDVARVSAALAKITGSDLNSSAEAVVTTIHAFNKSFKDSVSIGNTFVHMINNSALDLSKLKTILSYTSAAAEATGVTFEQTAAMIEQLANAGLSASQIGSSLRNVMMELVRDGETMFDVLERIKDGQLSLAELAETVGKRSANALKSTADNLAEIRDLYKDITSELKSPDNLAAWMKYSDAFSEIGYNFNKFYTDLKIGGNRTDEQIYEKAIHGNDLKALEYGYDIFMKSNGLNRSDESLSAYEKYLRGLAESGTANDIIFSASNFNMARSFKAGELRNKTVTNAISAIRENENTVKNSSKLTSIGDKAQSEIGKLWRNGKIATADVESALIDFYRENGVEPDMTRINQITNTMIGFNKQSDAFKRYKENKKEIDRVVKLGNAATLEDERSRQDREAENKRLEDLWQFKNKDSKQYKYTSVFDSAFGAANRKIKNYTQGTVGINDWFMDLQDALNENKTVSGRNAFRRNAIEDIRLQKRYAREEYETLWSDVQNKKGQLTATAYDDYDRLVKVINKKYANEVIDDEEYKAQMEKADNTLQKNLDSITDLEKNLTSKWREADAMYNKMISGFKDYLEKVEEFVDVTKASALQDDIADALNEYSSNKVLGRKGRVEKNAAAQKAIDGYKSLISYYKTGLAQENTRLHDLEVRKSLLESGDWTEDDLYGMTYEDALNDVTKKYTASKGRVSSYSKSIRSAESGMNALQNAQDKDEQAKKESVLSAWLGVGEDTMSTAVDAYKTFNQIVLEETLNRINEEIAAEQRKTEKIKDINNSMQKLGLISAEQYAKEQERLEREQIDKENELNEKAFNEQKKAQKQQASADFAANIAKMAMQTFVAWSSVLGGQAIAPGIIAATTALMAAQYGIQLSAISKQKFVPQKYEDGGYVTGASHAAGGVPISVGGDIREMEGGEFIVNKRATARNLALLTAINESGKYANGGYVSGSPSKLTGGYDTISRVADVLENLSNNPIRAYVSVTDINDGQKRLSNSKSRGFI